MNQHGCILKLVSKASSSAVEGIRAATSSHCVTNLLLKPALMTLAIVLAHSGTVRAEESCEARATQLNDSLTVEYIALEKECYPPDQEPTTSNDNSFTLSPECQAKYEALNAKATAAWDELYAACPDLPQPRSFNRRAPTKTELLDQVKKLKKKLRRARAKQRSLAQQCRR